MPAEDHRLDVLHGDIEGLGQEGAVTGGVEDAGHADHPLAREAGHLFGDPAHHVEGIRHHHDDGLWAILLDLL